MTILEKIYALGCKFANEIWWPNWSNFRWRTSVRYSFDVKDSEKFKSLTELQKILNNVYSVFNYTKDPANQLWDSIVPPPENYLRYIKGDLSDDCDGFHSCIFHILRMNNIECYLLSVNAIGSGHCVLIMKYKDQWQVIDYKTIYDNYDTPSEAIEQYNKIFETKYKTNKVVYNGIIDYSYETGKFSSIKLS